VEVVNKIKEAASTALALDNTLGEAHVDLAITAEFNFDWTTAEKEFQKGLELSPGNVVGRLWYAKFLGLMGRADEVFVQRRIAAQLDPVSPYAIQSVAGYLSVIGRYDEAVKQFKAALALEPNFGLAHQGLGVTYLLMGLRDPAFEELRLADQFMDGRRRRALLGFAYGVTGQTAQAHRVLSELLDEYQRGRTPAVAIAQVYVGLGDNTHAFEWLNKAVDQRDLNVDLKWDSVWATIRSDTRYKQVLHRMKLE
jgi:serine/threonine-protein kinase